METGAFGMSTGLIYPPGLFAATDELVELARVVAGYGGIYASHIRGEGATLLDAIREAITIAEQAGLPVEVSHHKAVGRPNWGMVHASLRTRHESAASTSRGTSTPTLQAGPACRSMCRTGRTMADRMLCCDVCKILSSGDVCWLRCAGRPATGPR
jgi:hypothetical protein